eukprot:gene5969-4278_t
MIVSICKGEENIAVIGLPSLVKRVITLDYPSSILFSITGISHQLSTSLHNKMFEYISYAYANSLWALSTIIGTEKNTVKSLTDPGTFLSGAIAGGAARMLVLPLDNGGAKGVKQTVLRRMPQMGFLLMFYTGTASQTLPGTERNPGRKMATTFLLASCAGFNMRFVCNPINRVADESLRTGNNARETIRKFRNKTLLQFWYCGPNLFANALYFGVLLTTFEGLRRFTERNILPIKEAPHTDAGEASLLSLPPNFTIGNYISGVGSNFVCGGIAAAFASTVCYPYSANRYLQTVIHDSSLCRGLMPTLLKEVPQVASASWRSLWFRILGIAKEVIRKLERIHQELIIQSVTICCVRQ